MKKEERIKRYGEAAYERYSEQTRVWAKEHREQVKATQEKYREVHKEEAKCRTTKYREENYSKHLEYNSTGVQGKRNVIRATHRNKYRPYKDIIAPDSQLHHEWVPDSPEYRGIALVEADQHMHGFVDVIEILDGGITLLTEEEVRRGKKIEK
jgi:hypothetical protein